MPCRPATIVELWERMNHRGPAQNLVYYHEGRPETIRIMLRPIGVMPDQLAYLNYVSLTILNALKRLPDLYLQDFLVRSIVPFRRSKRSGCGMAGARPIASSIRCWAGSTRLSNSPARCGKTRCGSWNRICAASAASILARPASSCWPTSCCRSCRAQDPELDMEVGQDFREIFIQEVLDHPAGPRPPGPERLLRRAQVCGAGNRRAGSAGRILSRIGTA